MEADAASAFFEVYPVCSRLHNALKHPTLENSKLLASLEEVSSFLERCDATVIPEVAPLLCFPLISLTGSSNASEVLVEQGIQLLREIFRRATSKHLSSIFCDCIEAIEKRCSSREPSEHLLMAAVSFIEETLENASSIRRGPPSESAYRQRLGHDSDSPPLAPFASVLDSEETLSFVDRPLDSEAQKIEGVTELPPVVGEVGMADALADEKMRTVIGATVARLLGLVLPCWFLWSQPPNCSPYSQQKKVGRLLQTKALKACRLLLVSSATPENAATFLPGVVSKTCKIVTSALPSGSTSLVKEALRVVENVTIKAFEELSDQPVSSHELLISIALGSSKETESIEDKNQREGSSLPESGFLGVRRNDTWIKNTRDRLSLFLPRLLEAAIACDDPSVRKVSAIASFKLLQYAHVAVAEKPLKTCLLQCVLSASMDPAISDQPEWLPLVRDVERLIKDNLAEVGAGFNDAIHSALQCLEGTAISQKRANSLYLAAAYGAFVSPNLAKWLAVQRHRDALFGLLMRLMDPIKDDVSSLENRSSLRPLIRSLSGTKLASTSGDLIARVGVFVRLRFPSESREVETASLRLFKSIASSPHLPSLLNDLVADAVEAVRSFCSSLVYGSPMFNISEQVFAGDVFGIFAAAARLLTAASDVKVDWPIRKELASVVMDFSSTLFSEGEGLVSLSAFLQWQAGQDPQYLMQERKTQKTLSLHLAGHPTRTRHPTWRWTAERRAIVAQTISAALDMLAAFTPFLQDLSLLKAQRTWLVPLLTLTGDPLKLISRSALFVLEALATVEGTEVDGTEASVSKVRIVNLLRASEDYLVDHLCRFLRRLDLHPTAGCALTTAIHCLGFPALPFICDAARLLSSRLMEVTSGSVRSLPCRGLSPFFSQFPMPQGACTSLEALVESGDEFASAVSDAYGSVNSCKERAAGSGTRSIYFWFESDHIHSPIVEESDNDENIMERVFSILRSEVSENDAEYVVSQLKETIEEAVEDVVSRHFEESTTSGARTGGRSSSDETPSLEGVERDVIQSIVEFALALVPLLALSSSVVSRVAKIRALGAIARSIDGLRASAEAGQRLGLPEVFLTTRRAEEEQREVLEKRSLELEESRSGVLAVRLFPLVHNKVMESLYEALKRNGEGKDESLPPHIRECIGEIIDKQLRQSINRVSKEKELAEWSTEGQTLQRRRALQSTVLPLLAKLWNPLMARLGDSDPATVCATVDALSAVVCAGGDFMLSRFTGELWPALDRRMLQAALIADQETFNNCQRASLRRRQLAPSFAEWAWVEKTVEVFPASFIKLCISCARAILECFPVLKPPSTEGEGSSADDNYWIEGLIASFGSLLCFVKEARLTSHSKLLEELANALEAIIRKTSASFPMRTLRGMNLIITRWRVDRDASLNARLLLPSLGKEIHEDVMPFERWGKCIRKSAWQALIDVVREFCTGAESLLY